MKKIDREPYCILTEVGLPDRGTAIMCCFCRYAEFVGSCGEYAECECGHPLGKEQSRTWKIEDMIDNAMQGSDCWLFRPVCSREDAVDIVGIWLQGKHIDWDTVPKLGRKQ